MKPKPFEIIVEFTPQSTKTGITYEAHQNGSLIRCNDCKWWREDSDHTCKHFYTSPRVANDFCSYAEPKETS